jgi:hypothetical protein
VFANRSVTSVDTEIDNLAFHNLTPSDTPIPSALKRLLGLGLNFCPTPKAMTRTTLLDSLPYFRRTLRLRWLFDRGKHAKTVRSRPKISRLRVKNTAFEPPPGSDYMEKCLIDLEHIMQHVSWTSRAKFNMTREQRSLLRTLRYSNTLHVLSTDKNLGPALMTRTQYIHFCLDHLNQPRTYERSMSPVTAVTKLMKTRLRAYYFNLKANHAHLPDIADAKIITHDLDHRVLNRFYALAKIHKTPTAVRPIISNCNGIFEGLSIWLDAKLKPYLLETTTYLRDSTTLLDDLDSLTPEPNDIMITFDVNSLYTSLSTEDALIRINQVIANDPWRRAIMSGLRILLQSNYFLFGDTLWLQKQGTAMGTPVAPTFASLYLAQIENTILLPHFSHLIKYYKRYIDDGFMILRNHHENPFTIHGFLALYTKVTKLKFTWASNQYSIPFLDLEIQRLENQFTYRTHQKQLNLYLYLPAASAHPPGVLKGLIFGLLKKYRRQNPLDSDFQDFMKKLFLRLRFRGYNTLSLQRLFKQALQHVSGTRPLTSKVLLKLPYDPRGPSSNDLRRMLHLQRFQPILDAINTESITFCYLKPRTLKNFLCPTSLRLDISPTPASILSYKCGGGTP